MGRNLIFRLTKLILVFLAFGIGVVNTCQAQDTDIHEEAGKETEKADIRPTDTGSPSGNNPGIKEFFTLGKDYVLETVGQKGCAVHEERQIFQPNNLKSLNSEWQRFWFTDAPSSEEAFTENFTKEQGEKARPEREPRSRSQTDRVVETAVHCSHEAKLNR